MSTAQVSGRGPRNRTLARLAAYWQNSYIGKILEIHHELPGHVHLASSAQAVGF